MFETLDFDLFIKRLIARKRPLNQVHREGFKSYIMCVVSLSRTKGHAKLRTGT